MSRSPRRRTSRPRIVTLRRTSYRATPEASSRAPTQTFSTGRPPGAGRRLSTLQRPPVTSDQGDRAPGSFSADRLDVTLPVPPSINHQYATVKGRRILSATGRQYKTQVAQALLIMLTRVPNRERLLRTFRSHFFGLSIRFLFANPLRRDVDGGLKITQDAICQALGINDNRIVHIHLTKALDTSRPRIEVSLYRSASDDRPAGFWGPAAE